MSSRKSSEKAETGFKDEKEEMDEKEEIEEKRREKQEDRRKVAVVRAKVRLQGEGWGTASVPCGSPFRCRGRNRGLQSALTALPSVPPWGMILLLESHQEGSTHLQNSLWIQSAHRVSDLYNKGV